MSGNDTDPALSLIVTAKIGLFGVAVVSPLGLIPFWLLNLALGGTRSLELILLLGPVLDIVFLVAGLLELKSTSVASLRYPAAAAFFGVAAAFSAYLLFRDGVPTVG